MKICAVTILIMFYAVYIGKMLLQKRAGIQTDQIAKGKERGKEFYIELIMKIATYSVVPVEIISIFVISPRFSKAILMTGIIIGFIGDIIFTVAVITMKDSWRAGIAKKDKTTMVTKGIYRISRNPAFLGFDCVYIGILLLFFNWVLFIFSIFAMVMLHLQILQEERYLPTVFGDDYISYKRNVGRYIGR